jgi:glutaredoxin 3
MVEIYGTEICSFCLRAKRLVEQRNIVYIWKDVDDSTVAQELKDRIGDYKTIPQIFRYGRYIGGYSELSSELENTAGGFGDGAL